MPPRGDQMVNCCFDDASATRAVLKHPAWDHLINTSPEGWMEFYKSLHRNVMSFSIALVPFESFIMAYHKKGHGLCLCGLGIGRYHFMGRALFAVLQTVMPREDTYLKLQVKSVANDSCNGFELLWILQKKFITMFDLQKNLLGRIGTMTSFNMPNRLSCTVICCAIRILPTWMPTTAFSSSVAFRGAGKLWESCIS